MNNITYIKGNAVDALLEGKVNLLLHCCNAQGKMGSGIAKEIRERIPQAYDAYLKSNLKLGTNSYGWLDSDRVVANMVAQEFYGYDGKRYVDYGHLANCLRHINTLNPMPKIPIAIPYKMACDRAGGDWDTVLELITSLMHDYSIFVYHLEDL